MNQRNLLVIASQRKDPAFHLQNLTATADDLVRAFLDPRSGGCSPGLRSGEALVLNESHVRTQELVHEAIDLAGEQDAVLVLAFLGHADLFENGTVRFMAVDSMHTFNSIGLAEVATTVMQNSAIAGAIIIADVCMAGGAVPRFDLPSTGKRLALLMAACRDQEAYELVFSRALTRVLDEGVAEAPPTLSAAVMKSAILDLRERGVFPELEQQDPFVIDADGATSGPPLWVARNVRAEAKHLGRSRTIRSLVQTRLSGIRGLPAQVPELTLRGLSDLRDKLWALGAASSASDDLRQMTLIDRALHDVEAMIFAIGAADFARDWVGSGLTIPVIKKGAARADSCLPEDFDGTLEGAFVHIATNQGTEAVSMRAAVSQYLGWLGIEAGQSLDDPEVQRWARINQCTEYVNAIRDGLDGDERALRLIVSLHDAMGDEWPDALVAWVVRGRKVLETLNKKCFERSELATQEALASLIDDARRYVRSIGESDESLRRIELVAPSEILLRWRTEMLTYGVTLTSLFEVVARWSGRMASSGEMWRMRFVVKKRLSGIEEAETDDGSVLIDWFNRQMTADATSLDGLLATGAVRIVGVDHPIASAELFTRIVKHTPGFLWPTADRDISHSERLDVEKHWHRMPGCPSIRKGGHVHAGQVPSLTVRMIWDDWLWLDFCDNFPTLGLSMTEENS